MKTFSHFIGIDISKETLDFALVVDNIFCLHQQVENTAKGINIFIKELKKRYSDFSFEQSLFCMEHTARAAPGYLQQYFAQIFT